VSHLTAQTLQYDTLAERPFSWTLRNYQVRTMVDGREVIKKGSVIDSVILMEPKDFFYVKGQQETLTLPELDEFIEKQKMRGAAGISTFEVEYHKRFASPFAAFILTLIGASLSAEKRKGGMGFSIAIGIALSFAYIMFQTIFATFAINAGWSAMISVWIPNIIFAGIAFWLYKRAPQ
jgi:lipopolysaccharide export system permease protein